MKLNLKRLSHFLLPVFTGLFFAAFLAHPSPGQDLDKRVDAYVSAVFKKYDQNGDNILSGSEFEALSTRFRKSDTNGDGNLDRKEMVDFMSGRNQDTAGQNKSSPRKQDDSVTTDDEALKLLVQQMVERELQRRSDNPEAQQRYRQLAALMGQRSGTMPGGLMGNEPAKSKRTRSAAQLVDVDLHLLRVSAVSDEKTLADLEQALDKMDMDELADNKSRHPIPMSIEFENRISLTAVAGRRSEIMTGRQVPVVTGSVRSRDGNLAYTWNDVQTGLKIGLSPEIRDDQIEISLDIAGTFLKQLPRREGDTHDPTGMETVEMETVAVCSDGQSTMIRMGQENGIWILVVSARDRG